MLKKNFKNIYKLVWIMSKRQKLLGGILILLILICAGIQILSVYIIAPLVSAMTNENAFMETMIVKLLSYVFQINDSKTLFILLCFCISFLYIIKELMTLFQAWYSIKYSQNIQRELSKEVFGSYMTRDYDFFLGYGTAKVVRDVNEDPNQVFQMIMGFVNVFTESITSLLLLSYVVISDFEMAICMAFLALISLGVLTFGLKRKLLIKGEEARIGVAEKQKILIESIEGIKEVQVMKRQNSFVSSYYDAYSTAQKPVVFQNIAMTAPTSIIEGVFVVGIVMYMGYKAYSDAFFMDKLPLLASFLVAAIRMLPSIGRITNNANNIQFCVPSLESVYANIKLIRNNKKLINSNIKDSGNNIVFDERLELNSVSYHYQDSEENILKNLNLRISKGESVGIIGHSGAGKTTLADLILGLHVPQEGSIELDGKDIRDIPYEYSRVIGYVPQNVYLLDRTIRENIAFGVDPADIDDKDVEDALRKSKLYDFVMKTENGLNTVVGERGVKLSGGQRQRLAIARALYRKPQILVLDEATSALDNETESALMEQVESMHGQITLIIIAHRLSTIEKCDSVYEIAGGMAQRVK